MERAPRRRSLLWALSALLAIVPAATAQTGPAPGLSVALVGGYSVEGDLTPGLAVNTVLNPGPIVGAQAEYGFGTGLVGVRAAGSFMIRELDDATGKFNVFGFDLGPTVRPAFARFVRGLQPYATLTVGGLLYSAVPNSPTFAEGEFGADPVTRLNITVSIGADYEILPPLAVRFEVGDRVVFPTIGQSPEADGLILAHTPVIMLGARYRFGSGESDRPARAEEPAAAPEPEEAEPEVTDPEPEPEPMPAEPEIEEEAEPVMEMPQETAAAFTVQVGEFLTPGTARRWGDRMTAQGLPVWYLDRQLGGTDVTVIHAGAVATRAEAERLATVITDEFGWGTQVSEIGEDENVPDNAMMLTREFLQGR